MIKKRRCGIFFGVKATNGYKKSDTDGKKWVAAWKDDREASKVAPLPGKPPRLRVKKCAGSVEIWVASIYIMCCCEQNRRWLLKNGGHGLKKRNATGACRKTLYAESRAKRDRSERKSIKDRAKGWPVCVASSQRQPPYLAGAEHTEKNSPDWQGRQSGLLWDGNYFHVNTQNLPFESEALVT